jgi:ABC-type multidrug transport system permease subunit
MLMMAQEKIPDQYPFLKGETYSYVPILVVPRVLIKNKPVSHIGTHTLNVHIQRQTWKQTEKTTIAWGLLPEAYANFGVPGAVAVGAFFGLFYGAVTRISVGTSAFSTRSMFTVLILSFALASTEWTAGVYAAALFQSSVPILGMSVLMKIYKNKKKKYFPYRSLSGINLSDRQFSPFR